MPMHPKMKKTQKAMKKKYAKKAPNKPKPKGSY